MKKTTVNTNQKTEKKRKLIIVSIIAIALFLLAIFSTLAYLTSTTNTLDNVMTAGNITATLDEQKVDALGTGTGSRVQTGQSYTLLPGHTYTKDPQIHVAAGSESCYVYMIIDDELIKTNSGVYGLNPSPEAQMTGGETPQWTLLRGVGLPEGKTGKVYAYNSVIPKDTTKVQDAKGFKNFTLDSGLTSDQITALNGKKIIVNGAAIQSDGFDSAEAAWKAVYGTAKYTLTYNGNGNNSGSVPASPTQYEEGTAVTVLGNTGNLTKTGLTFAGWNTQSDGKGTDYAAGASLTINADTTLYAKWASSVSVVSYQVTIWGIGQDGPNTITFGPATGADETYLEVDGKHTHCIHNDSWETIIVNINAGKAQEYYGACLTNGCTHSVELDLNETIAGTKYTAADNKKASVLYNAINSNYRKWNNSYLDTECESANWATSRMRATLNGKTGSESTYAGPDCLDSTNCLLSCFPSVLQNNIKPKTYTVPTTWSTTSPYTISSSTSVSDKLWLPTHQELSGGWTGSDCLFYYYSDSAYGTEEYTKAVNGNALITASSNSCLNGYNEDGSAHSWWLRGPYRGYCCYAGTVRSDGFLWSGNGVPGTNRGLSACFIL